MGLNRYFDGKQTITNKPTGWCVREKASTTTNKTISLEFGIYAENDRFISIPIHFSIKESLIPLNMTEQTNNETYIKYYALPADINFKLSSRTSKNGKKFPLLVPATEASEAISIVAYAYFVEHGSKIISFNTNALSIRDYIPKDRSYICGIFISKDTKIITTDITYALSRQVHHKKSVWTEYNNSEEVSDEVLTYEPKTEFIKLERYNLNPKKEEVKCNCDEKCDNCTCENGNK